jgi:hypothetical protein
MITREDFMVSIFDYNKDAEEAERAERAAAAVGGPDSPPRATADRGDRNLSDGPGHRRGCGGPAVAGSSPCAEGEDRLAGWQWVVPAGVVAAVLAVALVWDKQAWLSSLIRQCKRLVHWPRARRRLLCCGERGCAGSPGGKCAA